MLEARNVVLFDIDRTAYDGFLLLPLVEQQARDGIINTSSHQDIIELLNQYEAGTLAYSEMVQNVLLQFARALEGKSVQEVTNHTEEYLRNDGNKFYPYVGKVIELLASSHDSYFVTAEPQFVSEATQEIFGATGSISTMFSVDRGKFTGMIDSALSSSQHKADAINLILTEHILEGSFAFGDSEGDIHMLAGVEYPVCVNPTAGLLETAQTRNWFVASSPDVIPAYVSSMLK